MLGRSPTPCCTYPKAQIRQGADRVSAPTRLVKRRVGARHDARCSVGRAKRAMPERVAVSPLDAFGGGGPRRPRVRMLNQTTEQFELPAFWGPSLRGSIKTPQAKSALQLPFSNR